MSLWRRCTRIGWSIVSNAEEKSSKASTDMLPLLRERNRSLTTLRRAVSARLIQIYCLYSCKSSSPIIHLHSQQDLRNCNPHVHEFRIAWQILGQQKPQKLSLVLDEKNVFIGEHSRRCHLGLREISIMMSDETVKRRSFTVMLKGGGIREMFGTHCPTERLHFVHLIPTGADCWHLGLRQKRV